MINLPKMEDDPQRRKPDITRAVKILGWKPVVRRLFSVISVELIYVGKGWFTRMARA